MKRFLLILSVFLTSLLAVAQNKITLYDFAQTTDDMVSGKFSYSDVLDPEAKSITFQVINYKGIGGVYSPEAYAEFNATDRVPEGETLSADTKFSFYIDALDLTGNVTYKFAIKAIKHMNNDSKVEDLVFVYKQGSGYIVTTNEAQATEFSFTYGLKTPELTNKKSSSVVISWSDVCEWGKPSFYTIFGRNMDKPIATTTETSYFIKKLVSEYNYSFFVRAYDENGNYLSSSADVTYTPERVDCITFTEASMNNKTISLRIYGYDNDGPFQTDPSVYKLINDGKEVVCSGIRDGQFEFNFNSTVGKNFRLETEKIVGDKKIKAVGLFVLKNDGTAIETQSCDIEFSLQATHVTQYTATLKWSDPGFEANEAVLEVYNTDKDPDLKYEPEQTIQIPNPRAYQYSVGALEHSTNYKLILKLADQYHNQAKGEVSVKTKVGSICELENISNVSWLLGCKKDGQFLAPYDVQFYTEYENDKPKVTVRFRLNSIDEINNVKLYYAPEADVFTTLFNIKSLEMKKGVDGWYSASFDKLSGVDNMDGRRFYFSVAVTPAKRCGLLNFYLMQPVAYQVGVGCQDEEVFQIVKFTKLYDRQSQFTLQTNGRMASVGVFPESGYNKTTGEFDLDQRIFYNNFDDSPSSFTLDISDPVKYPVGTYYLHIHDVYGEAGDLKYLWAIY